MTYEGAIRVGVVCLFMWRHVDFTCLNCFSQTRFASAVEHGLVDPKRRTRSFMEKGFM